jgi:hypothetical protein
MELLSKYLFLPMQEWKLPPTNAFLFPFSASLSIRDLIALDGD